MSGIKPRLVVANDRNPRGETATTRSMSPWSRQGLVLGT